MSKDTVTTETDYLHWAKETLSIDFAAEKTRFDMGTAMVQLTAQEHAFFRGLERKMEDWDSECQETLGWQAFMSKPTSPALFRKPFKSAVNKTYRINRVRNKRFPQEPKGGWITPTNWFAKLRDVVRGTIVCKYVDGPQWLAEKLAGYATSLQLESEFYAQGREDGYYAYHFYVKLPVDLAGDGPARQELVPIEIQITTQLQEILYNITHQFYAVNRDRLASDPSSWKWAINSRRFRAGYLSHTLHLLEAIIVQLRDSSGDDNS